MKVYYLCVRFALAFISGSVPKSISETKVSNSYLFLSISQDIFSSKSNFVYISIQGMSWFLAFFLLWPRKSNKREYLIICMYSGRLRWSDADWNWEGVVTDRGCVLGDRVREVPLPWRLHQVPCHSIVGCRIFDLGIKTKPWLRIYFFF